MTAGGGRKVSPVIADSSDCNVPARDSQADDFLPVQVILALWSPLMSPDQTLCSTTCYDGNFTPWTQPEANSRHLGASCSMPPATMGTFFKALLLNPLALLGHLGDLSSCYDGNSLQISPTCLLRKVSGMKIKRITLIERGSNFFGEAMAMVFYSKRCNTDAFWTHATIATNAII